MGNVVVMEPPEVTFFEQKEAYFSDPEVLEQISSAVQETVEWLLNNKQSIEADGMTNEGKPWFDREAYGAPLPNKMAEKERHYTLDSQAYEHGIAKFAMALSNRNVIKIGWDDPKDIVFLRSGEVEGWFHVLVRYSWKNIPMNLAHFRDTGDYHPGTPQSHAKSKLEALATLGFANVQKKKGFVITAGPVAKSFYEEVWYPVTDEFKGEIRKWSENG